MAESKRRDREIRLDYAFDRLLANKLQHAYEILVPDQVGIVNKSPASSGVSDEDRRDLRQGILGQTEGREHHCEPNGGVDRIRPRAWLRRSG